MVTIRWLFGFICIKGGQNGSDLRTIHDTIVSASFALHTAHGGRIPLAGQYRPRLQPMRAEMIRQATAKDEPAIRDCAQQAYARYVPLIGKKPAPMVADFQARIAAGHAYVAADEGGELQGFIVFYPEGKHILLENVAVLPSAARQGIGKSLIRFCEDEARRRGFDAVYLYTNEKMTENLSFYPRLGYIEVARRAEDGFNRVFFEKSFRGFG
jgi:ribosomal protein S18 acetylase RimI-like enzyme